MGTIPNTVDRCKSTHQQDKIIPMGLISALNNGAKVPMKRYEDSFVSKRVPKMLSMFDIKDNIVFVDSDFRFILAQYYYIMKYIPHENIKIIDISRDKAKIARQICRNHYYAGIRMGHLIKPCLKYNLVKAKQEARDLSNDEFHLYRGVWYTFEVEARKKAFKKKYPYIPIFSFDMDKDTTSVEVWKFLIEDFLGLSISDALVRHIKQNKKINSWEHIGGKKYEYTIEEARAVVDRFDLEYNKLDKPDGYL